MAQKKIDKRKFIEGIFNIGIFGDLLLKIRSDFNEKKKEYDIKSNHFLTLHKNLSTYQAQIQKNTEERLKKIRIIQDKIDTNTNKIKEYSDRNKIQTVITEKEEKSKNTQELLQKLEEGLEKIKEAISNKEKKLMESSFNLKNILSELEFHQKQTDSCPTCKRKYDNQISICEDDIKNLKLKLKEEKTNNEQIKVEIDELKSKQIIIKKSISDNKTLFNENTSTLQKLAFDLKEVDHLEDKNKELLENISSISDEKDPIYELIKNTEEDVKTSEKIIEDFQKTLAILESCKFVVSEEGVKTYIVKKMLKVFNQQLNFYLKSLDAPCTCTFDEMFEETLHNLDGKECSYFNFSGGERKRIDIAILFMFQDILRSQTGVSFNLSMYDELFDSAIDECGIHKVMEILNQRREKYNESIYIVSHNKSALSYSYNNIIQLQKREGITSIVD